MITAASEPVLQLERQLVIAEARTWLTTPYHHAARLKGVGVDCIQLLAAVYEAAGVVRVESVPHYPHDWWLHRGDELLLQHLAHYCVQLPSVEMAEPADIATFLFGRQVSHAGIIVGPRHMIHALSGRGVTLETFTENDPFGPRLAGIWRPRRWVE